MGWIGNSYVRKNRHKLIEIKTERINIELTMTMKLEINSCPLTTLHTNTRGHIMAPF